jgi:hypothetical protein
MKAVCALSLLSFFNVLVPVVVDGRLASSSSYPNEQRHQRRRMEVFVLETCYESCYSDQLDCFDAGRSDESCGNTHDACREGCEIFALEQTHHPTPALAIPHPTTPAPSTAAAVALSPRAKKARNKKAKRQLETSFDLDGCYQNCYDDQIKCIDACGDHDSCVTSCGRTHDDCRDMGCTFLYEEYQQQQQQQTEKSSEEKFAKN